MPIIIQEEVITKGIISQEELVVPFRVGIDGVTFTPSVSVDGVISWTNDGGLDNPTPIYIKGQTGDNVEFRTNGGYVQWKPISGSTWTNLIAIADLAQLSGTTGQSTTIGMTQKAITDNLALKVNTSAVKQVTGTSTTDLMSQKAVTDELLKKIDKSSITPDFGSDATKVISQKGYTDDMKAWLPSSVYSDRVLADSGSIRNRALLFDSYKSILDLSANTLLQYSPEMGLKQSVSGVVYKASKLYDMSSNNNDAAQATAGSQPYIVNNIAPNERAGLWGRFKRMAITPISFSATDKWSMVVVASSDGASAIITSNASGAGAAALYFSNLGTYFQNINNQQIDLGFNPKSVGYRARYYLVAKGDNTILLYVNGVLVSSQIISTTAFSANGIFWNSNNANLYSLRILNKDLSKSEIESIDNFLKVAYPDIDGTAIGSQYWATSNAMISVTGNGTAIPEVQSNDASSNAELIINAADREFSSDTGFWTKTAQVTIGGGVCNIKSTDDSAQSISRAFLTSGKTYKVQLDIVANRGGTLRLQSGSEQILFDSTVGTKAIYIKAGALDLSVIRQTSPTDIDIDNISVKECGWADAQAIYDYYISVGKSVLEATKAAAMFCKYNNSDDNAAVYGYIYNGYARNLIALNPPKGWRSPVKADGEQIITYLGGGSIAGGKLKFGGTQYWDAPNSGATNESGFTMLGGGARTLTGNFSALTGSGRLWFDGINFLAVAGNATTASIPTAPMSYGYYLRLIRNAPVGEQFEEVTSGVFSTDIATAQKELSVKFGYSIESVKVSSANALTNFKVEMRSASGTLLQTLMTGKNVPSGNIPTEFKCLADTPIQLQDYKLWVTAVGNGGDGMEIKVMTKKILF